MPIHDLISAIHEEIARLEQALQALEGTSTLSGTPHKAKRGRPPGKANAKPQPVKQTRTMTEEGRARIAAAQKARWAAKKSAEKKATKVAASPVAAKKTAPAKKGATKKIATKRSVMPSKPAAKKKMRPAKKTAVKTSVPAKASLRIRSKPAEKAAPKPVTPEISQEIASESAPNE